MATNVSTINHGSEDYSTIALWESDTDTNLVAAGDIEVLEVWSDDGAISQGGITIAGATTDSSNYRVIRAKSGDEWGGDLTPTSVAAIAVTTTNAIQINESYFRVEDIFFDTPTSNSRFPIRVDYDYVVITRCFFDDGSGPNIRGDYLNCNRCVMLNTEDAFDNIGGNCTLANCTLAGGTYGIYNTASNMLVYNTISEGHSYHDSYLDGGSWHSSSAGNMSGGIDFGGPITGLDDVEITASTSPGAGNFMIVESVTEGAEDFQLVDDTDNDAIGYGETLTALESTDAFGNTANTNWDVGAFNLASSSTTYTKTVTANGILEKTSTLTTSGNGLLEILGTTVTTSGNGLLETQDTTITTSGDGYLQEAAAESTVTTSGNAYLKALDATLTTSADSYLSTLATTLTTSSNALLELLGVTVTTSVEGYIQGAAATDAKAGIFEHTTGTSTGTRDFTTSDLGGETAKGGIFFSSNATATTASVVDARMSIGWTDGTTHFSTSQNAEDDQATSDTARLDEAHLITATVPGTNNVSGRMAFSALATNGITGNITTAFEADYVVKCMMFGGADDCEVKSGNIAGLATNGTSNVTDVGFQPDFVFLFTHDFASAGSSGNDLSCNFGVAWNNGGTVVQRSIQYFSDTGQGAGDTEGVFSDSYACGTTGDYQCEVSDFDSQGFSLTSRTAASGRVYYLAVKLSGWDISLFDYTVPTSTGSQAHTTPGFTPDVILEGFTRNTSTDTNQTTGEATAFGFGISSEAEEHTISATDEDAADPTVTRSIESGTSLQIYEDDGSTLAAVSTIDSFDSGGYTRDWTTVPTTGFKVFSLCLGASIGLTTNTLTTSANGLLEATKTQTTSGHGLLQDSHTTTLSGNALLESSATLTTSADAQLYDVNLLTFAGSGQLSSTDNLVICSSDSILAVTDTELFANADSVLVLTIAQQTSAGAVLEAHYTITTDSDALLKTLDTTLTMTGGGQLITGTDLLVGADAILKTIDATLSSSGNGLLSYFDQTLTAGADGQLTSGATLGTSAGAILQAAYTLTATADGELVAEILDQTITTSGDSLLVVEGVAETLSADAILEQINIGTVVADSILKALDRTRDAVGDAMLYDPGTVVYTAAIRAALNTVIGTQQITTSKMQGVSPDAAIQITTYATSNDTETAHAELSIGFTDGTDEVCVYFNSEDNQATTDTVRGMASKFMQLTVPGIFGSDIEASHSAFISNGIELNITNAPDAAYLTHLLLFGGTTVEAKVGTIITGQPNTEMDINTVGFEPDVVFFIDADRDQDQEVSDNYGSFGIAYNGSPLQQRAIEFEDDEGDAATAARGSYITSYALGKLNDYRIEVGNFDSDGFSIWVRNAGANSIGYLALKLPDKSVSLSTLATQPFTGSQELDLAVNPDMVVAGISMNGTQNTTNTTGEAFPVGFWLADGTDEYTTWMRTEDAADPTNTGSYSGDALTLYDHTGATAFEGSLASFDNDGLTIDWTTVDPTPRYWWLLVIGDDASTSNTIGCTVEGYLSIQNTLTVGGQGWLEVTGASLQTVADSLLSLAHTLTLSADSNLTLGATLSVAADSILQASYTYTLSVDGFLLLGEGLVKCDAEGFLVTPGVTSCSANGFIMRGNTILADAMLQLTDQTVNCGADGFILGERGIWDTVTKPAVPDWQLI